MYNNEVAEKSATSLLFSWGVRKPGVVFWGLLL